MSWKDLPQMKRMNRILFRIVIPVLIAGVVVYALLVPPVFQLNQDYYISGNTVRVTGGEIVAGPGAVSLWGIYPWVYGTVDDRGFAIHLEDGKVEHFAVQEKFERFLQEEQLDLSFCRPLDVLRSSDRKDLRMALKKSLSKPRDPKKSAIF